MHFLAWKCVNFDQKCHWSLFLVHDDVIKWKHFPRYWPFVRGIHRSPVNSPHKGQWRGALMFTLICARINGWVNNRKAGDLRRYRAHYDVIVMCPINNILALGQIKVWRRPADKPLSEPMMVCLLTHICVARPQWVNPLFDYILPCSYLLFTDLDLYVRFLLSQRTYYL